MCLLFCPDDLVSDGIGVSYWSILISSCCLQSKAVDLSISKAHELPDSLTFPVRSPRSTQSLPSLPQDTLSASLVLSLPMGKVILFSLGLTALTLTCLLLL